jgi:ribonuclease Z
MQFETVILGCGAATPTMRHLPSAQAINWNGKWMLVDAGEGVQLSLRKHRIPFQKIERIFISHMHGDHVLGLPGLIGSLSLLGRQKPLTLHGPENLQRFVTESLRLTETHLKFQLNFVRNDKTKFESIFEENGAEIKAFPVKHRIEAYGYQFNYTSPLLNLKKEMIDLKRLERAEIIQLKKGISVTKSDGTTIDALDVCHPKPNPIRYVYSGDTKPCENVRIAAEFATALYHESTFLDGKRLKAKETGHSTAHQAGKIAREAQASQLIIGHFSSRYRNEQLLLDEAMEQHNNVALAYEGLRLNLGS